MTTPNPHVPPVPLPMADLNALAATVTLLRLGMMSLGGLSGGPYDRAVTLNDLRVLGIVTQAQLDALR